METRFRDTNADAIKTDLLVLPVEEKTGGTGHSALDRRLKGKLSEQIQKSKFTGAEGSSLSCSTAGILPASHLLLVGFGKANDVTSDTWRRAGARARKEASVVGAQEIAVFFAPDKDPDGAAGAVVEGAMLASYRFNKYRSNSSNHCIKKPHIVQIGPQTNAVSGALGAQGGANPSGRIPGA